MTSCAKTLETQADPRWARMVGRDPAADGTFFYGVKSTGVYCRPSCPSRMANPRHVSFHDTAQACEAAGFRPCKRCRPDEPSAAMRTAQVMARVCRLIERAETPPSLKHLAATAGLSPHHFHRSFKAVIGVTPRQYAAAHRANRVRDELVISSTVTEGAYSAGFNSSGRFYEAASGVFGMTPSTYRAGGAGEDIRFAVGQCSLGAILVASTTRGVCAIFLGDEPEPLVRDLQDRFPMARLSGGEPVFEVMVAQVVGLVDDPKQGLDLPLDIRGAAFQQRVWQALRDIPAGSTATYAEIAKAIGAPRSARAVANACAANPLAVAIPCHRVVRTDGALSGYRWGVARKRALLDREAGGTSFNEVRGRA